MHDNDGVGASFYFTSIPCGNNIPQLFIGRFVTVAYIYKAIKSCQKKSHPAYRIGRAFLQFAILLRLKRVIALTAAIPSSYIQQCRPRLAKRVLYIHLVLQTRSAKPITLATPERLRRLVFSFRAQIFLCMCYGCWIGTALLTRTGAVVAGDL